MMQYLFIAVCTSVDQEKNKHDKCMLVLKVTSYNDNIV